MKVAELIQRLQKLPAEAEVICMVYDDDESGWMLNVENGDLVECNIADPADPQSAVILSFERWAEDYNLDDPPAIETFEARHPN
jgi:hypothetical protein